MKVILIDWNAYGNADILDLFVSRGYEVRRFPYDGHLKGDAAKQSVVSFTDLLGSFHPDYVFSYHYFPEISCACAEAGVSYISWIYDSPAFDLYSPTILNPINRIFVFDRGIADEFTAGGITTVHHLPLGVVCRDAYGKPLITPGDISAGAGTVGGFPAGGTKQEYTAGKHEYISDVTFIGSMYTEPKHRLYDKFNALPDYTKGYLDAVIESQKHIYGMNILERFITPEIEADMQKVYPTDPNSTNAMTPAKLYSQFVLSRQVTALERRDILTMLASYVQSREIPYSPNSSAVADNNSLPHSSVDHHSALGSDNRLKISLYTHDTSLNIPGVHNMGPVDYNDKMYRIFTASKINLNITLRSILTGIPLRALDIMSCGGFLISNYQEELCEYFVPGEDFAYYEDYDDLRGKIEYYLSHDSERRDMAASAHEKIYREHTLSSRLDIMESTL